MGEPHFLVSFSYIIWSSCISHCEFDFTQRHILSQSLCRSFNNGVKTAISGNLCHKAEFTVTQNFLNFIFRWLRLRAAVFSNPLIPKISGWYSFLFLLQNSQLFSELMFFVWFCCCFVIPYVIQLTAILLYILFSNPFPYSYKFSRCVMHLKNYCRQQLNKYFAPG